MIELNMPMMIRDHMEICPSFNILIPINPITHAAKMPNVFAERPVPNLKAARFIKNKPVNMSEKKLSPVMANPNK